MRKYDVSDEYLKYYRHGGDLYKVRYTCYSRESNEMYRFDDYVSGAWVRENIDELMKFHEGGDTKYLDMMAMQCVTFMSEKQHQVPDLKMLHYYIEEYISEDGTLYSVSRNGRYSNIDD